MGEETSEEEWVIVEKEGSSVSGGKMSLLYRVGKKIVITGAVITSAPFVLPPLIVISSIGFAFAVPFGFVFASYACTDKIMSKLLSRSPNNDVGKFEELEEKENDREEEEFEEDVKKNLEMRIELVGDEDREEKGGFEEEELEETEKGNQLVLEESLVGFDAEEEEKKMVRENRNGFGGDESTVEEREIPVEDVFYTIEEEVKPIEGTEGTVMQTIEKEEVPYAEVMQAVEEIVNEKDNILDEVTIENIKEDEVMGKEEGTGETVEEYSLRKALQEEEVPFAGVMKAVEENGYKENEIVYEKLEPNAIVEKEKPAFETKERNDERRIGEVKDSLIEKIPVTMEKEVIVLKKDNTREIADESGLHLFDEETATSEQYIPEVYSIREVTFEVDSLPQTARLPLSSTIEESSTVTMEDKSLGAAMHTDSAGRAETKPDDNLASETKPADLASVMKTTVSSKEVLYSEEKMWELIDAMRKIVGYKAAIQPSFAEELKALYIFTGVEPPVTFKNQLDLVEVNDQIRLLMTIIGVKI